MTLESLDYTLDLFSQIGGTGKENCVFFALQDRAQVSERGTIVKSAARSAANGLTFGISGLVEHAIRSSAASNQNIYDELNLESLNNYRHFLINETEDSIAILPILLEGTFRYKIKGSQVFHGAGIVIPKNLIKKIDITKFMFLTPTIRGVRFDLIDGTKIGFMVATNITTLPYHIGNFKKFNQKYKH